MLSWVSSPAGERASAAAAVKMFTTARRMCSHAARPQTFIASLLQTKARSRPSSVPAIASWRGATRTRACVARERVRGSSSSIEDPDQTSLAR